MSAEKKGVEYIPPYSDPDIMAGQVSALPINITIIIMGALPRNQHHHNHRQLILQDENLSGYLGPGGAQPVAQC